MPRQDDNKPVLGVGTRYVEPRCRICMSASRIRADRLLAAGYLFRAVAEDLIASDPDLAFKGTTDKQRERHVNAIAKSVERHSKRHIDVKDRAVRRILENRALEQGILVDGAAEQMITTRGLLEGIVAKGIDQISDPDSRVRYQDAIEAAKLLEEQSKAEAIHQVEILRKQVDAIASAVRELVDPVLLPQIVARATEIFEEGTVSRQDKLTVVKTTKELTT